MASRTKRARAKASQKKPLASYVALVLFIAILFILGVGASGAVSLIDKWLEDVPPITNFENYNNSEKTKVYANDGVTLIGEFYFQDREPVEASQVSPYIFQATVAIEDERYWSHNGVDFYGIARAAVNDLMGGNIQGASTITQQLVRHTVLQDEANDITIERKVREIYLAMQLEKEYSKETVLMMYLNTINYGDGAWGIQSAARHYFSKDAADLTLVEAALLAGIPQQPTFHNPVYYPDLALSRRNAVLDRMEYNGYITAQECAAAKLLPIELNVNDTPDDGIYLVPYFTAYVRNILEQEYSTDVVFGSGLTVYTTIDLNMQAAAEEVCREREETIAPGAECGLTTIDPRNGYILAVRGGKDFYADQWSSSTDMHRQPGSTFKVFGLIAALEQGYGPSTPVSGAGNLNIDGWKPENFGGAVYGMLTLQTATWESSNTAYARVVRTIGPNSIVEVAHRCGITSDLAPVNSIVLGSQGVNTLEMASAFGTIGNNGVYVKPTAITKILDRDGNVIYEHQVEGVQALTPEIACAATNILRGVVTNGTGAQAAVPGFVVAGKTGTSEEYRDIWFVGYTPQLSTAMWIGYRDLELSVGNASSSLAACPYWSWYMSWIMDGMEYIPFPTAATPHYNPDASFMTRAEREAAEEEARRKEEEEEERRRAEEEANKPPDEPEDPDEPDDPDPGGPGDGTTPP